MTHAIITTGPDGSPVFNPEGGPEAQARRELVAAYRAARSRGRYYGSPYASAPFDSRFSGPLKAAEALGLARDNLARKADADSAYAAAVAAREAREIRGGMGEGLAELRGAERAALDRASRCRSACAWYGNAGAYGPGTWQGGQTAPEGRRKPWPHGSGFIASAMHGGERGQLYGLHDDSDVLRNVADAHDVVTLGRGHTGWYDNPFGESFKDGSGLCLGVVGQLRGRDGRAVYVAGYRFGGHDDSGTFDLRRLFVAEGRDESEAEDARKDAARAADGLAEAAAELEREHQTAWQAGAQWADKGERLAELRGELRAALAELRTMRSRADESPTLCRIMREAIAGKLAERAEIMRERAELAEGDCPELYFYPREARLADAFCEAAGLSKMPGAMA